MHRIAFKSHIFRGFPMMPSVRRWPLAAVLVLMLPTLALAQRPMLGQPFGPQPVPFVWWKSEPFKKDLGLSADQASRIEKIWEGTRLELRQEWDELSRLEEKFSRLIQNDADEAVLTRQIDRVETARSITNKTRSVMLVQMLKVLTPDQRSRFNTLYARWQQDLLRQPPAASTPPAPSRDPNKRPED
jgi:Spy/CpxP family protein refolding chaperone